MAWAAEAVMAHLRLPLLAALLHLAPSVRAADKVEPFKVVTRRTCVGEQTEYGNCENKPACPPACTKENTVDCTFDEWADWANPGGCTGICTRQRTYKTQNNECGKPCSGAKIATKACDPDKSCLRPLQDTELSEWGKWSECGSSKLDQIFRERKIKKHSANGGKTFDGPLRETKPCGEPPAAVSCKMSEWAKWSDCSEKCGYGLTKRERKIESNLKNEGAACAANTTEQKVCNEGACKTKADCKVSEWGSWGACTEWYQQERHKTVTEAVAGGAPCGANGVVMLVKEVKACDYTPPENCKFNEWKKWEDCDKSCDGGQTTRTRTLKASPKNGGSCKGVLSETAPCGQKRCMSPGETDCSMKAWGNWSACSAPCGWGVKSRSVQGINKMKNGGRSCKGPTSEVVKCKDDDCAPIKCAWHEWGKFEPCSVTCGGGFMRRHRSLKTGPRFGGAACEAKNATEVQPCEMKQCAGQADCVDGEWAEWDAWGKCSAQCGSGYRSRTRSPSLKKQANYCGWPAVGTKTEFESCTGPDGKECAKDQDCKLSEWGAWDDCSATCFGMRQRSKTITQYATANGKSCKDESLKEMEQCNPAFGHAHESACGTTMPVKDCTLSQWGAWEACSSKCNGGQKIRSRNIKTPPQNNGTKCEPRLQETTECNMHLCASSNCVDCKMGDWSAWGACSESRQSTRTREVTTLPDSCGKKCEDQVVSEVKACSFDKPDNRYCAWGEWSGFSSCPTTCSQTRKRRSRTLGMLMKANSDQYLFKVSGTSQNACFGTQFDSAACDMSKCKPLCKPRDCTLGDWDDWSVPMGYGLCKRSRSIQTPNNECGKACVTEATNMEDTKACALSKYPENCRLSEWSDWSHCDIPETTRYRLRHILNNPRNGGKDCDNSLEQAQSCYKILKPVDCKFTEWSKWGGCDTLNSPLRAHNVSCGTGYHSRTRRIETTASAGGKPCGGPLSEVGACDGEPCIWKNTTDCAWKDWKEWSECKPSLQKFRVRGLTPATNNGKSCNGEAEQIVGCATKKVDCKLNDWSKWSECSSKCRGSRHRSRDFDTKNAHFGKACIAADLKEAEGCNSLVPCADEEACKYSEWEKWGDCHVTCGFAGQEIRHRKTASNRKVDGLGCSGQLSETRACKDLQQCKKSDCKWDDWGEWTKCTKDCGGGQTSRTRDLASATIGEGAKSCDVSDMRQTVPCKNTAKDLCKGQVCQDGKWEQWSAWEACSATCGDGVTWRRRVVSKEANYCGTPVSGPSRQSASCKSNAQCPADRDCEFADWANWGSCSATCDGTKRRVRSIKTRAVGNGKACGCTGNDCDNQSGGASQETAPCNPVESSTDCPVFGQPVDCELTSWSSWATCAVTCGVSQRERTRKVNVEARNHGKACEPALTQTGACDIQPCPLKASQVIQDCKWREWGDWSACDQCGGLMYRGRQVDQHAQFGGKNCTGDTAQEMKTCDRGCADSVHCSWSTWAAWSDCDISCVPLQLKGSAYGKRIRKRNLQVVKTDAKALLYEEASSSEEVEGQVQELYRRAQNADSRRWQEVSAAFAFGCLSFLVGFGVIARPFSRRQRQTALGADARIEVEDMPLEQDYDEEDDALPESRLFETNANGRRQALL